MQVIHELRDGVKLRKVRSSDIIVRRHIEFELTPFEILLDQIRAKKYQLKKLDESLVKLDDKRPAKNARDIILEFIRSRPPLKKSMLRKLKPKSIKLNMHDQLMIAIRTYSKPLKKVTVKQEEILNTTSGETTKPPKKKLLMVDKKLLSKPFSSSDDDDSDIDYEELQNSSIFFQSDQYLFQSSYIPDLTGLNNNNNSGCSVNNTGNNTKRSIKAPESLKSPLAEWSEPVEDWRALVTEDILLENGRTPSMRNLDRRHTMNLADTITANLAALNIFASGNNKHQQMKKKQKDQQLDNDPNQSNKVSSLGDEMSTQTLSYIKSGPGHADFGFVGMQEFFQVRNSFQRITP